MSLKSQTPTLKRIAIFPTPVFRQICLLFSAAILFYLLQPLEIGSFQVKILFHIMLWLLIPGSLFLLFDYGGNFFKALTMFILVAYGIASFLGFMLYNLCKWDNRGTVYTHKTNQSLSIIEWVDDCGALDSSPYHELFKERKIIGRIKWVTQFDAAPVDTAIWQSVER
jgi:hypothetical protein